MSMMFDNGSDVVQLVSAKLIFMWVHNKTNSRSSGVAAYTVNSLMMVVATTERCWSMDWLYQNLDLLRVCVCVCVCARAFVENFRKITCMLFTDSPF